MYAEFRLMIYTHLPIGDIAFFGGSLNFLVASFPIGGMCPQFIHDLQEVMGTDGLHQLLQACGWLGEPLPENMEDFMGQWIGLRENLQETMVFTIKYRAFL